MITAIQTAYELIFNSTYTITKHIDERTRDKIVAICLFVLTGIFFYYCCGSFMGLPKATVSGTTLIGIVAILVMCVFGVNGRVERVEWNPWVVYPYYIASILMIVTGYMHPVGTSYTQYAWTMLLIFPAIYFVWNNRGDYDKYFKLMAKSISIQGAIVIVLTYFLRPINEVTVIVERYSGLTTNPNILGMIGLIVTTATLYLIATEKKKLPGYIIVNALFVSFIWLSVSRTALIALVLQLVTWLIMVMRINFSEEKLRSLLLVLVTVAVMVVSIPVAKVTLTFSGSTIAPIASAEEKTVVENRFDLKDKAIAEISSGRDYIWKEYVKHFNLLGNDAVNFSVVSESGVEFKGAHNTYIDIAFRSGVIAGGAYLAFMTAVLAVMNINILRNRKNKYMIFVALAIIAYFVESIFEIQIYPFARGNVLLFYLALAPVWEKVKL